MMETSELSNLKLKCLIRQSDVPATPEEKVRQALIFWMINHLKYPKNGFVVEKAIKPLGRRLDILFYQGVNPLVLIECKREKWNDQAKLQIQGYNHFISAPIIALACDSKVESATFANGDYVWVPGLPSYSAFQ